MFLEVDLNYPKKLHKLHRDFPLAPVRCNVSFKELSPLNQLLIALKVSLCNIDLIQFFIKCFSVRSHIIDL